MVSEASFPAKRDDMEKILMTIEKTADFYSAYSENCDGIYSAGDSIAAVRADTENAVRLIKKNLPVEQWPEAIKGEYEIEYRLDPVSFLKYYSGFLSLSGLGKITGINPKQLSNYLNGRAVPRRRQLDRISEGIHKFAHELLNVSL
jgi:hypothetical protein